MDGKPKLEVLELPDQTRISGPVQVHQQMTNNADIRTRAQPARSNQAQVQYGNLLSLPFGDGMLYVEPVYVKTNQRQRVPAAAEGPGRLRAELQGLRRQPRRRPGSW